MSSRLTAARRGPTIKEIAKEAGVSISLVSKVLHGRGGNVVRVSNETAQMVRETAQRLNYVPNGLARSLRMNRAENIGLIFENFGQISAGPLFYVDLLDGVAQELFAQHYRLTILPEVDPANPSTIADGRLDGVIWCKMPSSEDFVQRIAKFPIPIVALNAPPPDHDLGVVFVSCDNRKGADLVVDHLVSLGHKHIAFVMEKNEEFTPDAQARLQGFREACLHRGISCCEEDFFTWVADAREFPAWYGKTPHTAIFAWNEGIGAAILRQAKRAHISVPNEISVIGFDSTRFCETTRPRLTAIRQPIRDMATFAAKTLIDEIEGNQPLVHDITFPCSIDIRDSTAPPRTSIKVR